MTAVAGYAGADPALISRTWNTPLLLLLRALSSLVDFFLVVLLIVAPLVTGLIPLVVLSGIAIVVYFPITEGLWGGSLGKLVTRLVVVDAHGQLPGIGKATSRTVFRVLELNPFMFGPIPAGVAFLATPNHQRLGDLAAATFVVPLSELRKPPAAAPELANVTA